ncbi:MAG: nucleoside triphosphate pyrophosphohydrolase [Gemmatimonadetes bacterium]|nr:nucleoside triphosphate pyrophosphohydrolase [Gemmatimonadota bacterium]
MSHDFDHLRRIMERLLGPGGCPWDREQTLASLRHHTIEEAYELCEAIEEGNTPATVDELGDLLFHIIFYAELGAAAGEFSFDDVTRAACEKLIRRHPHVFGEAEVCTAEGVVAQWEEIKQAERGEGVAGTVSALDGVSRALPALVRARKLSDRAARVGFDWPKVEGAIEKLHEEVGELLAEIERGGADPDASASRRIEAELGDLLFAAVNVARFAGVDPEVALTETNQRFERRFRHVEAGLEARGKTPRESTLEEMDRLWDEAKGPRKDR